MARDHPTLDLSSYTLAKFFRAPTSKDVGSCLFTPGLLVAHSSNALPIVPEDRPLEAVDVETEREMDTFAKELNEVLTFDGGVLEEGEITTTSTVL